LKESTSLRKTENLNICICTDAWLGINHGGVDRIISLAQNSSKNQVNVYLIDRSTTKSLSALFFDNDTYYEVKNGVLKKRRYPFYILFLFPGLLKFLQFCLTKLFSLITRITESDVSRFFVIDPYLLVKLLFVCKSFHRLRLLHL
jgi:hypothetical protein